MSRKDPLVIYWAPAYSEEMDLSLLFEEPKNLYKELVVDKEQRSKKYSMFNCPAVADRMKSTFVFRNTLKTKIEYDFTNLDDIRVETIYGYRPHKTKAPSMQNGGYITLNMAWLFFCEESTTVLFNTPMMHEPTKLTMNGMFPPAKQDIGMWFRPVTSEIQLWKDKGTFEMDEGDPMFYFEVLTDRPIILKKFKMTPDLNEIVRACVDSTPLLGSGTPLIDRYRRFKNAKMDKMVMNAIKKSLIDNE